jgi:hypothetical protein
MGRSRALYAGDSNRPDHSPGVQFLQNGAVGPGVDREPGPTAQFLLRPRAEGGSSDQVSP